MLGSRPRLLRGRSRLLGSRPRLLGSRPRPTLRPRFAALPRGEIALQIRPRHGPRHRAGARHPHRRRRTPDHGASVRGSVRGSVRPRRRARAAARVSPCVPFALLPALLRPAVDVAVPVRVNVVRPADRGPRRVPRRSLRNLSRTVGQPAIDVVLDPFGSNVPRRWTEADCLTRARHRPHPGQRAVQVAAGTAEGGRAIPTQRPHSAGAIPPGVVDDGGRRPVAARSEPAAVSAAPAAAPPAAAVGRAFPAHGTKPAAPAGAHVEERVAPRVAESPSGPWRIVRVVAPRVGAWPPVRRPDPRPVIPTRPPHDGAAPWVAPDVARRVTEIHLVGRRVIDPHVLHVVDRNARWNLVDVVGRNRVREEPGSRRRVGDVPDRVVAGVVAAADAEHRRRRIDRVFGLRALDRHEPRLAVVPHVQPRLGTLDGGRLRNLRVEDRVFGLVGARHARAHGADVGPGRDLRERRGEGVGRHVGPARIDELPAPEPAAREERVVVLRRDVEEDVTLGVVHREQFGAHAPDGPEGRLALGHDELGGFRGDQDPRRFRRFRPVLGRQVLVVFFLRLAGLRGEIRYVGGRTADGAPGTLRVGCLVPPLPASREVVAVIAGVEHHEESRVHDQLQGRALDLTELRLAVQRDENGRLFGKDDSRRVVLQALGALPLALGHLHVFQRTVVGNDELPLRDLRLDDFRERFLLFGCDAGKPHAVHLDAEDLDGAVVPVDGDARGEEDHPELRRLFVLLRHRDGRARRERVPFEGLYLRLVHDRRRALRGFELPRPRLRSDPGPAAGAGQEEKSQCHPRQVRSHERAPPDTIGVPAA